MEEDKCSICMSNIEDKCYITPCNHKYHITKNVLINGRKEIILVLCVDLRYVKRRLVMKILVLDCLYMD